VKGQTRTDIFNRLSWGLRDEDSIASTPGDTRGRGCPYGAAGTAGIG
jgi:hypothetical protein